MKRTNLHALLFLVCIAVSTTLQAADGARLFNSADFVENRKEGEFLTRGEAIQLGELRRHTALYRNITVVKLNLAALSSGIVTLFSPEGKEYQYIGARSQNPIDQTYLWQGKSAEGTLVISYDEKAMAGEFREEGKVYYIRSLSGGRVHIVTEAPYANSFEEPPSMSGKVDPRETRPPLRPLPGGKP